MKNADGIFQTLAVGYFKQGFQSRNNKKMDQLGFLASLLHLFFYSFRLQAVYHGWPGRCQYRHSSLRKLQNTGSIQVTGAQWSSLAGNGLNVVMGVAKSTPWGAAGTAAGTTVAEFGFNLATASQQPSTSGFNYSNEGRNYKTQTYNFGPNYRGYGFTDPRILDASESYRSLNPTNSASINQTSQTSSSGGSGGAWNTIGGGTK